MIEPPGKINLAKGDAGQKMVDAFRDVFKEKRKESSSAEFYFDDIIDLNTRFNNTGIDVLDAQFSGFSNVTSGYREVNGRRLYFIVPWAEELDGLHTRIPNRMTGRISKDGHNLTRPLWGSKLSKGDTYGISIRINGSYGDVIVRLVGVFTSTDALKTNDAWMQTLYNYITGDDSK